MIGRSTRIESTAVPQRFSRADALVAMAQEILRGARASRSHTELVVTISAERLHGGPVIAPAPADGVDDLCDVGCCAHGTAISVDAVRRLACDAGIVTMVEGADGAPLSVGRKTRSIPGAIWCCSAVTIIVRPGTDIESSASTLT